MAPGYADPFLTQMSYQGQAVAGGNIRALRKQKSEANKRVLTWSADETYKARSCEEMLMFEKPDPNADRAWPPYAYPVPNMQSVIEFEQNINKFI